MLWLLRLDIVEGMAQGLGLSLCDWLRWMGCYLGSQRALMLNDSGVDVDVDGYTPYYGEKINIENKKESAF